MKRSAIRKGQQATQRLETKQKNKGSSKRILVYTDPELKKMLEEAKRKIAAQDALIDKFQLDAATLRNDDDDVSVGSFYTRRGSIYSQRSAMSTGSAQKYSFDPISGLIKVNQDISGLFVFKRGVLTPPKHANEQQILQALAFMQTQSPFEFKNHHSNVKIADKNGKKTTVEFVKNLVEKDIEQFISDCGLRDIDGCALKIISALLYQNPQEHPLPTNSLRSLQILTTDHQETTENSLIQDNSFEKIKTMFQTKLFQICLRDPAFENVLDQYRRETGKSIPDTARLNPGGTPQRLSLTWQEPDASGSSYSSSIFLSELFPNLKTQEQESLVNNYHIAPNMFADSDGKTWKAAIIGLLKELKSSLNFIKKEKSLGNLYTTLQNIFKSNELRTCIQALNLTKERDEKKRLATAFKKLLHSYASKAFADVMTGETDPLRALALTSKSLQQWQKISSAKGGASKVSATEPTSTTPGQ